MDLKVTKGWNPKVQSAKEYIFGKDTFEFIREGTGFARIPYYYIFVLALSHSILLASGGMILYYSLWSSWIWSK